jgi:hypothetical protein
MKGAPELATHARKFTCIRQHTSASVSIRQHPSAYVSIRQHTQVGRVGARDPQQKLHLHPSAYVSIRQHTSAYVSRRKLGASEFATRNRKFTCTGAGVRAKMMLRCDRTWCVWCVCVCIRALAQKLFFYLLFLFLLRSPRVRARMMLRCDRTWCVWCVCVCVFGR